MIEIKNSLKPQDLSAKLERLWALSGEKIKSIEKRWDAAQGSPVFTVRGEYTSKGWTEWTQGFVYGSALLQYDATIPSRTWPGTSPTWACTTTASTTSAPTAISGA
jgi:unsaturated chondroitin disaccharide hydrolase